jgi:formylglycine-generating enzyme required for sulfatase activity
MGEDVSWVGAVGMSGNVAEWTSTIFDDYPYVETDGRENSLDVSLPRVVRGGSFVNAVSAMQTFRRRGQLPQMIAEDIGFRCVMDYEN